MIKWVFLIVFAFFNTFAISQSFKAFSNAEEILEGFDFQVTFKLDGAKGNTFQPPSFNDFRIVGGPSSSSSMSIINGRTTQSMSYTYALMPKTSGNFNIGSASIKVGGKTLRTDPLNIKVIKSSENKNTSQSSEEVFLELELSDSIAYVGQQVILKYVIYTSIDVRSYNFINESEYKGFYVEDLQNHREQSRQVVRNGKQYLRQTLKSVALFPQQTGKAEIGSALVNLGIAVKSERPSFFFSTSMKSKRLTTPPREISVLSTPRGAPSSFSGGIGSFKMTASVDRNTVSKDGAITLKMNFEGDGDARFVGPPKQTFGAFEIYDPNLLSESNRISGGKINAIKSYEYLLVPQEIGLQTIQPEFTFYNVDSAKYITIYGPKFNVQVVPGNQNNVVSTEDLDSRIVSIATSTKLYKPSNSLFSPIHIGAISIILLGFVGIAGIKWNNDRISGIDPKLIKSQKAQKVAIAKLATAKSHLDKGVIKEFYSSLSECLFSYISDKLGMSANNISKDDLSEIFIKTSVPEDVTKTLSAMIERSEMAIYAGFSPDEASDDYDRSINIIMDIEKSLD
ncbi:MAG: BatD family protein [Saprospiraceae bacterium]|nr:BatD family protein [Saprospiraceae bacterium]|tara:strand:- start:1390 stop:3090 length:1701 start_codon:yes stop_codon:yes gene_type:complete